MHATEEMRLTVSSDINFVSITDYVISQICQLHYTMYLKLKHPRVSSA